VGNGDAVRPWLAAVSGGVVGAVLAAATALLWNAASPGSLVRFLGGVAAQDGVAGPAKEPVGSAPTRWQSYTGKGVYNPACDYRLHLLISPDQAHNISVNLSRYTGDAAFIYPTVINAKFLQAVILEAGRTIVVETGDEPNAECPHGQASLSNLPGMCFATTIERRC
jgi:hypothetical protein